MTDISVCCASRPVFAAQSAASTGLVSYSGGLEELRGGLRVGVRGLHRLDLQIEAACQVDHVHHRARQVDVARLDRSGGDLDGGIGRSSAAGGELEEAAG